MEKNLLELQEKIKSDTIDSKGNININGITLHLAMIYQDIKILHKRFEEMELKVWGTVRTGIN